MPGGTPDIQQMQRDAEQRIKNMQQRANRAVNRSYDMPPVPNFTRQPQRQSSGQNESQNRSSSVRQPTPDSYKSSGQANEKKGLFSRFKGLDILKALNFQNIHIDNDVLIIIALIFLLSTEETDELLLLALVYIML